MTRFFLMTRWRSTLHLASSLRGLPEVEELCRRYRLRLFRQLRKLAIQWSGVAMIMVGIASGACAEDAWPNVPVPASLSLFTVGENVTVNGMAMRVQGFVSPIDPPSLVREFRQSLGVPLVEKSFGSTRTLGRAQDSHYLTVSIVPAGAGSRGTVSVARMTPEPDALRAFNEKRALWLGRMPSDTQLPLLTISRDGALHSYYFAFTNRHSVELNLARIKNALAQERMELVSASAHDRVAPEEYAALRRDLQSSGQIFFSREPARPRRWWHSALVKARPR